MKTIARAVFSSPRKSKRCETLTDYGTHVKRYNKLSCCFSSVRKGSQSKFYIKAVNNFPCFTVFFMTDFFFLQIISFREKKVIPGIATNAEDQVFFTYMRIKIHFLFNTFIFFEREYFFFFSSF